MKVLSYLELCNAPFEEISNFNKWLGTTDFVQGKPEKYTSRLFYSQPFRPELITELFEGWTYDDSNYIYWYEPDNSDYVASINEDNNDLIIDSPKNNLTVIMPKTLDRFICNCQDAGIELEWRLK